MTTNTKNLTSKRVAAGLYEVTAGNGRTYTVEHVVWPDEGNGYGATDHWVATDPEGWMSDPFSTKRDALDHISWWES